MKAKTRVLVLFGVLVTSAYPAGACTKCGGAASGYEPEFRKAYPGTACKPLAVKTGPAHKLCAASRAHEEACSNWYHEPSSTMAFIEGRLVGTVCERYGTCTDGAADVLATAKYDDLANMWTTPALHFDGVHDIDIGRSLQVSCTEEGAQILAAAAELRRDITNLTAWTPSVQRARTAERNESSDIYLLQLQSQWREEPEGLSVDVGSDVDGFSTKRGDYSLLLAGQDDGLRAFYSCEPGAAGLLSVQAPKFVRVGGARRSEGLPLVEIAFKVRERTEVGEWCENRVWGSTSIRKRALGLDAEVIAVRALDARGDVLADWSPL
ncbi:MAG: hypothetical protein KC464_27090 [Myxococcales bacterium]|nr:hypothetical protein [Myxococcales bacterium]